MREVTRLRASTTLRSEGENKKNVMSRKMENVRGYQGVIVSSGEKCTEKGENDTKCVKIEPEW